jgi:formate hydrogenlyase subunit 3/multisubunit Na+/H+ antiporter MnhD subunit
MFMAAGLIGRGLGHDRIDGLAGVGQAMPLTLLAFALAGLSLMGLPPSGGFVAKWLLTTAAIDTGQWWWALVVLAGGVLTGAYLFRVLARCLATGDGTVGQPGNRTGELVALALALASVAIGLVPLTQLQLVAIGRLGFIGDAGG